VIGSAPVVSTSARSFASRSFATSIEVSPPAIPVPHSTPPWGELAGSCIPAAVSTFPSSTIATWLFICSPSSLRHASSEVKSSHSSAPAPFMSMLTDQAFPLGTASASSTIVPVRPFAGLSR
jgi:hypothetical protein